MKKNALLLAVAALLTSGAPLLGQSPCSALARDGIFDYENAMSEEQAFRNQVQWLYESSISSKQELDQFGLNLGIDIKKIPIKFGLNSDSYDYSFFRREMAKYLTDSQYMLKNGEYTARKANVELAKTIANCKGVNVFQVRHDDNSVSMKVRFNPSHDGEHFFVLKDISITPDSVASFNIPNCSINGRTRLPLKIGISGCDIPIIWKNPNVGFYITVNSNYSLDYDLTVKPKILPVVEKPTFNNTFLKIQTLTGKGKHHDTDDRIDILIVGENGEFIEQRLNDPNINDFEKGAKNTFIIVKEKFDIGTIKAIKLSIRDRTNDKDNKIDDWYVDSIIVTDVNREALYYREIKKYIGDGANAVGTSVQMDFFQPVGPGQENL